MLSDQQPLFMIRSIATMLGVHPQTLRLYERHGFVNPTRTKGNTRLYSWQDVRQLRIVLYLTRELGVNLAGVELILDMQHKIDVLQQDIHTLRQSIIEIVQRGFSDAIQPQALVRRSARTLVKVYPQNPEITS